MEMTKEQLKSLHLVELKNICKTYRINQGGTKTQIVNRLIDYTKPTIPTIHSHPISLSPNGKKIVGVLNSDTDKSRQIGRQVELKKSSFLYYSIGVRYYTVDDDFSFSEPL